MPFVPKRRSPLLASTCSAHVRRSRHVLTDDSKNRYVSSTFFDSGTDHNPLLAESGRVLVLDRHGESEDRFWQQVVDVDAMEVGPKRASGYVSYVDVRAADEKGVAVLYLDVDRGSSGFFGQAVPQRHRTAIRRVQL